MIEITLPWPDKRLSPNSRSRWAKIKAKEQKGLLILATLALCKLREEIKDADTLASDYHGWYREEKEKAEKCKELLREIEKFVQVCPICLIRIVDHPFEIYKKASGHAKDCELAKELADD